MGVGNWAHVKNEDVRLNYLSIFYAGKETGKIINLRF